MPAVWRYSEQARELTAVAVLPAYRRRGDGEGGLQLRDREAPRRRSVSHVQHQGGQRGDAADRQGERVLPRPRCAGLRTPATRGLSGTSGWRGAEGAGGEVHPFVARGSRHERHACPQMPEGRGGVDDW